MSEMSFQSFWSTLSPSMTDDELKAAMQAYQLMNMERLSADVSTPDDFVAFYREYVG